MQKIIKGCRLHERLLEKRIVGTVCSGSQQFVIYTGSTLYKKGKEENGAMCAFFWNADGKPISKDIDVAATF